MTNLLQRIAELDIYIFLAHNSLDITKLRMIQQNLFETLTKEYGGHA